eukprot:m.192358 g.192358  ORF g.192358 m.192358 type:complete len:73 (+) comp39468_c0_seq8:536-754(+)
MSKMTMISRVRLYFVNGENYDCKYLLVCVIDYLLFSVYVTVVWLFVRILGGVLTLSIFFRMPMSVLFLFLFS